VPEESGPLPIALTTPPPSIAALPEIIAAVGHQIEVHMDGGIRSGQDVLKAIALGAKGTYIAAPSSTA